MTILRHIVPLVTAALVMAGCTESYTDASIPREVEAVSAMKELGVVEYRVKKIIKANDEGEWYKIGERKILLSCTAYLKAGIDLTGFSMDNIKADRSKGTVEITLPHARLLSLDIPASEIREEFDKVTLLRSDFSVNERNALLRQGERQIRRSVPSLGILPKAEENAEAFFRSVFSEMGYTDINVVFK